MLSRYFSRPPVIQLGCRHTCNGSNEQSLGLMCPDFFFPRLISLSQPENVLFTEHRVLKLADFGLAIDLTEERAVTRAGTLGGSLSQSRPRSCPELPSSLLVTAATVVLLSATARRVSTCHTLRCYKVIEPEADWCQANARYRESLSSPGATPTHQTLDPSSRLVSGLNFTWWLLLTKYIQHTTAIRSTFPLPQPCRLIKQVFLTSGISFPR